MLLLFLMLAVKDVTAAQSKLPSSAEKPTQIITDTIGRQVEVPVNPQRIACLCPEAGYAIAMFGKSRHYSGYLRRNAKRPAPGGNVSSS